MGDHQPITKLPKTKSAKVKTEPQKAVATFFARGGGDFTPGDTLNVDPTPAGEFLIYGSESHVSKIWRNSRIKWGAETRSVLENGTRIVEVKVNNKWVNTRHFENPGAKGGDCLTYENILGEYNGYIDDINDYLKHSEKIPQLTDIPKYWHLNDFGPRAVLLYEDKNKNGKFDGGEKIRMEMFHSTPFNHIQKENGIECIYQSSHGCIHVSPDDMDTMWNKRYFAQNNVVQIHKYDEVPPKVSIDPSGKPPYKLHFYPGIFVDKAITDKIEKAKRSKGLIIVYGN